METVNTKHCWTYFGIVLFSALVFLTACTITTPVSPPKSYTGQLFAMDTYMELTAYGPQAEEAVKAAEEEIRRLDALLSVSSETSEVYQLNRTASADLSEDTAVLLEESLSLYEQTGGAFDITVYPLMELWGFTTGEYQVPNPRSLSDALALTGVYKIEYDHETGKVTLAEGQAVDFGGIAKGFTSDRVMEIFAEFGITSGKISLGGNIQTLGRKTDGTRWRIGIRDPEGSSDSYLAVLSVENQAVITSGDYERNFTDEETGILYHHILNPETGMPADTGLTSVTIVSENGMLADGLSTALFVMGIERGADFWRDRQEEFQVVFVTKDGRIYVTEGLEEWFESDREYEIIR